MKMKNDIGKENKQNVESVDDIEEYDLSYPPHKEIIRQFESELGSQNFTQFLIDKGAWVMNERYPNGAVRNPKLYRRLYKQKSALGILRMMREKAREYEEKAIEKMVLESESEPIDRIDLDNIF